MSPAASNIALLAELTPPTPQQGQATIVGQQADAWVLNDGRHRFEARRAASCLLTPELGDRVWFVAERGEAYVIAVLERAAVTPAQLHIGGDAELRSAGGTLTISATKELSLRSQQRVTVRGDEVLVHARLGRILLDECSNVLRSLFTHVGQSTMVAKLVELFAERLSTHSKTSVRTVETVDHVEAGNIDYRAGHSAQLGATHTRVTGSELVKVDGAQIHVG